MPDETPEIACTLDEATAADRREWAADHLAPHVQGTTGLEEGIAIEFDPAALDAVAEHVRQEANCCSFANFRIEFQRPYDTVRLEITGPEGAGELLRDGYRDAIEEATASSV